MLTPCPGCLKWNRVTLGSAIVSQEVFGVLDRIGVFFSHSFVQSGGMAHSQDMAVILQSL